MRRRAFAVRMLAPRRKARWSWTSSVNKFEFEKDQGQREEIAVEMDIP
jgi:hypothetical protein